MWPDLGINFHLEKQNMFNEIWSISSSPSVEWSPATTGRVDADILNGSLSGEPDYFGRNKISSGGDLSHYSSASLY